MVELFRSQIDFFLLLHFTFPLRRTCQTRSNTFYTHSFIYIFIIIIVIIIDDGGETLPRKKTVFLHLISSVVFFSAPLFIYTNKYMCYVVVQCTSSNIGLDKGPMVYELWPSVKNLGHPKIELMQNNNFTDNH